MSYKQKPEKVIAFFQWNINNRKDYYGYITYLDAIKSKRMHVITNLGFMKNKAIQRFYANTCKKSIIRKIWFYILFYGIHLKKNKEYVFLFNDGHPILYNLEFLDWIKKRYQVKLVLVIRNMIQNKLKPMLLSVPLEKYVEKFDLVVTDEPADALHYNLYYAPDPFSIIYNRKVKKVYDICFSGLDKGRMALLRNVQKEAIKKNVKYDFRVIGAVKKRFPQIRYMEMQPYTKIIQQDMQSNCILEIMQPGQDGFTLRLQEAVCLNKKLLTNNPKVKENPYYNSNYMQYFEKIEEIDWDFVKEITEVNYHYKGEYSPLVFLDNIENELIKGEI